MRYVKNAGAAAFAFAVFEMILLSGIKDFA
jgi:hypothetical protein